MWNKEDQRLKCTMIPVMPKERENVQIDIILLLKRMDRLEVVNRKILAEIWSAELIKKAFSSRLKIGDTTPVFKALYNSIKKLPLYHSFSSSI